MVLVIPYIYKLEDKHVLFVGVGSFVDERMKDVADFQGLTKEYTW
jgi:hypothetical protein